MRGGLAWAFALCLATAFQFTGCSSGHSGGGPDTDEDGLSDAEEWNVYGTSPLLKDTDGDGFSDFDEVIRYAFNPANDPTSFNPLVADVPQMTLYFPGPPVVSIAFTDAKGETRQFDNSTSDSVVNGVERSRTDEQQRSDTLANAQTITDSVALTRALTRATQISVALGGATSPDAGADGGVLGDAGEDGGDAESPPASPPAVESPVVVAQSAADTTSITLANAVSTTASQSTTLAASIAITEQQSQQNGRTVSQSESYAETHTITQVGGSLKITTIIQNRSRIAFQVSNIVLSAVFIDKAGRALAVQNLTFDPGQLATFARFSLAPGEESGPLVFVAPLLSLGTTYTILRRSNELQIRLATYEIVDATERPSAYLVTEIGAKTALVVIDYGRRSPPELYSVATNADPAYPAVSASKVFGDILRIPYEADKETGLRSVRGVSAVARNGPHWRVKRMHRDGPNKVVPTEYGTKGEGYDFDGIELQARDVLHVAYLAPGEEPALEPAPGGVQQLGTGAVQDGGVEVAGQSTGQ